MLKLLHTGDIHLDSPFTRLDPRHAEIRKNELRAAFTSMMTYAGGGGADMVLIAGDMIDHEFVTRETVALMKHEFERVGCPVIIAPGNHDCCHRDSIWMKNVFPENVFIFKSDSLAKFSFDDLGCDVYGYAFTEPSMDSFPAAGHHPDDPSRINILLAHADMSSPLSHYCPVTPAEIDAFGADYTALGHVHNAPHIDDRASHAYAYCGCLEGRSWDETGVKGALAVEIGKSADDTKVRASRVCFSKKAYEDRTLSVAGMSTQSEADRRIAEYAASEKFGADTLLRLHLTGAVEPSLVLNTSLIESGSLASLFYAEVHDDTTPDFSSEALENDIGIRGEVYRKLLPELESEIPEVRRGAVSALRFALAALAGENIIDI